MVVIPGALLSCFFRETIRVDTQAPQIHKENRNPFPFPKSFWMKPKQKAITVYLHGSFQILPAATHLRDVPKSDAMPRPCYDRCLQWSYRRQWKEFYVFLPREQHVYKLPWNILNITKVWFTCECVLVWSCGLALVQLLLVYPASSTDISAVARCGLMPLSGSGFQNLWQEIPGVQKSFSNNFQICSSGVWGFVYPLVN